MLGGHVFITLRKVDLCKCFDKIFFVDKYSVNIKTGVENIPVFVSQAVRCKQGLVCI